MCSVNESEGKAPSIEPSPYTCFWGDVDSSVMLVGLYVYRVPPVLYRCVVHVHEHANRNVP